MNGVEHVRPGGGFKPSFTMFSKLEVNGKNEHPLFTFLKVKLYCRPSFIACVYVYASLVLCVCVCVCAPAHTSTHMICLPMRTPDNPLHDNEG